MELDGIFLDLYGTLTSGDREAVEATCAQVVRETGIPLSARELSVVWGERFLRSIELSNGDRFETLFDLEARTLVETLAEWDVRTDPVPYARMLQEYWCHPPLQADVEAFLSSLVHPLCIVSNADHSDAEAALADHGIRVHHLITSEGARVYKPHPGIFEAALDRTGWRRDRVIHVGDSLHSDVGGAVAAGVRSVWVNRAHRIHDIGTHRPDYEIGDLTELTALLG
jgi:2-haloacid dehalogenase/putative hydrolase of the HAD superfamily